MAVGTRLRWRLVIATVLHRSTSNDESGDGLCLSKNGRGRVGLLRRSPRLLLWSEAGSVPQTKGLAVFGLKRLQRGELLGAVYERLPQEEWLSKMVSSQRLGGFWDGLCREGFLEQIIHFDWLQLT